MIALVQAAVLGEIRVEGELVASIGQGLCAYVGVEVGDTEATGKAMAEKLAGLRILPGKDGPFDRSVADTGGELLLVSNFTLLGVLKGRRPSWSAAARPEDATGPFDSLVGSLRSVGLTVATGVFGAEMDVLVQNHGPTNLMVRVTP